MNIKIIISIALLFILGLIVELLNNKEKNNTNIDYNKYYKKDYIMTQAELKFYRQLKMITNELNLSIFPQVNLERIINVKNNDNAYRNRIKSRSIDYTIVNNENCKIICCIELDDYSHNYNDRQKRDKFINELFENVNIKLYRYNLNTNIENIKQNIIDCI